MTKHHHWFMHIYLFYFILLFLGFWVFFKLIIWWIFMNPLLNPGTRISSVKYISCLVLVSYLTHTYVWSIYYLVLFYSEFYIKSLLFWNSCFDLTLHYQLDSSILFLSNIVCSFSWYNSTDLLLPSAWHCLVYVTLVYWFPSRAGILCFVYFMCLFFNNLIYYKICLLFSLLAFSFQYVFFGKWVCFPQMGHKSGEYLNVCQCQQKKSVLENSMMITKEALLIAKLEWAQNIIGDWQPETLESSLQGM